MSEAQNEPQNRIRVQLTFEISVHEPGFPSWLTSIVDEGINTLIDDGKAKSPVMLHAVVKYNLTRVSETSLRRRAKVRR